MRLVTRVLIVDDSPWRRNPLDRLLALTTDLEIGGVIATLPELVQACRTCQPHVLILSGRLKPFAFDLPALIAQLSPSTKIIAVLNAQDPIRTQALLITKLQGALFQHELDEAFLHGIRLVTAGKTWFTEPVLERLLRDESPSASKPEQTISIPQNGLTAREQEVLRLLAQGLGNKAIAQALCLTEGTIEQHLNRIYRKLNVNTRVEAATRFIRLQR